MTKLFAITRMDVSPIAADWPKELRQSVRFQWFKSAEEAAPHLAEMEVLLTSGNVRTEWLAEAARLKWVHCLSAGVDRLPLDYLKQRGILLTNSSGVHSVQMSEYAMSMMLQWVRRSRVFMEMQQARQWRGAPTTDELYEKTIGILGTGQIAQAVAPKARAFGMRTIGYNRSGATTEGFDQIYSGENGLIQLLKESDFVISILPGTKQTRHLIDLPKLKLMKPTAFLINMGRGYVIKEDDLIHALQAGIIAGAGLDVFEQEPLREDSPLWELDNVYLTPHISGNSPKYIERAAVIFNENLKRYVNGDTLRNKVELDSGY
ncbi:D-2-hydroxyacid dehydrogenase [Paenibacillus senegalensis]|uniref:D-2-hydroxyacid dehydrogenase n=1 Tax=Paenibacillus senegalensis TaxID=1465766 RepID=UPI0002882B7E|nr:D-2-hydroxyacid dehydrogenase [Paenibacillus senegalensis]